MFTGFTTVTHFVDDLPAAITWYTDLLGYGPYFVRPDRDHPAYAEFRIGPFQHELGLISSSYRPDGLSAAVGGGTVYWQTDDVAAAFAELIGRGAESLEPVTTRAEGWQTASVIDPFGIIVGLIHSPLYADVIATRGWRSGRGLGQRTDRQRGDDLLVDGELLADYREDDRERNIEGTADGGQQLAGCFLLSALDLGQVTEADPGGLGDLPQRLALQCALLTKGLADQLAQQDRLRGLDLSHDSHSTHPPNHFPSTWALGCVMFHILIGTRSSPCVGQNKFPSVSPRQRHGSRYSFRCRSVRRAHLPHLAQRSPYGLGTDLRTVAR
ncbi:Uncharacterized conserved protein PhnB, glyoxalase superfamily [Microlunatus soli]|uniref:Uncharacterized conserved protein PhnB, glyoxalase superfamily n=1 Tax=Microlunatus soli TaxID=630515 RepID=A0A1H1ZJC0_9ACTN|nr:Uncharacterized conserved protein PhnB, glyoxalase superfamily [Microlunatus soli]